MENTSKQPLCYSCKYRGSVPGDAHSSCHHPETDAIWASPVASFVQLLGSRMGGSNFIANSIGVKGHPHGIRMGWFAWPVNFDPTWLENCNGYTKRQEEKPA